jgi:hypothetical protein
MLIDNALWATMVAWPLFTTVVWDPASAWTSMDQHGAGPTSRTGTKTLSDSMTGQFGEWS